MSKKNLYLGGILILLIIAAVIYQGPFAEWKSGLSKPKNFLAKIDASKIDKIEIIREGKTIELDKQGDKWKIAGEKDFFAASDAVADLQNKLSEMAKADLDLASSNKEKKADFKTDGSGTKVKLMNGNNIAAEFIAGNRSNDFAGAYIAEINSDNTYKINCDIFNTFNRDEWRDLTVFSLDKEKINKIRFQYPNREFTIEKKDGKWSITIPQKMDINQDKIVKILDAISSLKAEKIPEQNFAGTGLEKHGIIAQIYGENIDSTVMIGDKNKEGLYYAKKGDSDNIYLLSEEQRKELNKKIEDLK